MEPLFPFGHGLSYTTFGYGNLKLGVETNGAPLVSVAVDVTNTGDRAGAEIVQLYVRDVACSVKRPFKELKAFEKVPLAPGETRTVRFTLGNRAFSFHDENQGGWVVEPGRFEILVGSSSGDIRLLSGLTLSGATFSSTNACNVSLVSLFASLTPSAILGFRYPATGSTIVRCRCAATSGRSADRYPPGIPAGWSAHRALLRSANFRVPFCTTAHPADLFGMGATDDPARRTIRSEPSCRPGNLASSVQSR